MTASRLAIQGAGHLASALVEGFCRAGVTPISIHNRTAERAHALARVFPGLRVFADEVAFDAEPCPLLLVIPGAALLNFPAARIERLRRSGRLVVSCVNGLPVSLLDERFPGVRWLKAIPSVAAAVGKSVTFLVPGAEASSDDLAAVRTLFKTVGPVHIQKDDAELDRLAVVTSCMPGLLAALLDEFARAYDVNDTAGRALLVESALASLVVAQRNSCDLQHTVASVANPGGLTDVGVAALRDRLPAVFTELKERLDSRRYNRREQYLDQARKFI